jgi:hypothetical protein
MADHSKKLAKSKQHHFAIFKQKDQVASNTHNVHKELVVVLL